MPNLSFVLGTKSNACNQKRNYDFEDVSAGNSDFQLNGMAWRPRLAMVAKLLNFHALFFCAHSLTLYPSCLCGNVFRTLANGWPMG